MLLQNGSRGPEVKQLQEQLAQLGFYAGGLDSQFGPQTDLAVKDFQRRLGLVPDGKVGTTTSATIVSALATPTPGASSCFKRFKAIQDEMFAQDAADYEHMAFQDRGIHEVRPRDDPALPNRQFPESPFKKEIANYPDALRIHSDGSTLVCPPVSLRAKAYPAVGELPSFATDNQQTDTLPFLSDDIQQACLCIGGSDTGQSAWKASWYGRQAMSNEQYWSATKYLQVLDVVCQANRKDPQIHISDCRIHSRAEAQKPTDPSFDQVLVDMVSYRKGVPQSNAIALMFKWLSNPGEPNVQEWISNLTGNDDLQFLGKYGSDPFFADPELYADSGPLVRSTYPGTSGNYVSAYDLVRAITMLGWHNLLAPASKLPGAQWHSLASVIKGLGTDCARYLDVALQELGLDQVIQSPVIISKLGFGTTGHGEDALTYVALMSCIDPRPVPRKLRTFAFALRIPTSVPRATSHDAKMASEVTELVRRVFSDALT